MKSCVALLYGAALSLLPELALALDPSAAGRYALVHVDGHVTDSEFRLTRRPQRWSLESRRPDGRWQDVTCTQGCELQDSTPADRERLLLGTALQGQRAECIHDQAFAFCLVSGKAYMISLVTGRPIVMNIVRVD